MKFLKCLVAAVMLLTSTSAMAQFGDSDSYTRLHAGFVSSKLTETTQYNRGDNIDPKGFNFGILQGFSVSDDLPLFLEIGANATWLHSADDFYASLGGVKVGDLKTTFINVAVPLNLAYKYEINDKIAVSAHAGLNFKVNALAKFKAGDESINLLKKDDMGNRDERANIFQLGGNLGAGLVLGDFYLGYQFQPDFMKFMKNRVSLNETSRFMTQFITLGYQGEIF